MGCVSTEMMWGSFSSVFRSWEAIASPENGWKDTGWGRGSGGRRRRKAEDHVAERNVLRLAAERVGCGGVQSFGSRCVGGREGRFWTRGQGDLFCHTEFQVFKKYINICKLRYSEDNYKRMAKFRREV